MTNKKLTDAEIKKALECCSSGSYGCDNGCPLDKECDSPIRWGEKIMKSALDLINRKDQENESLKAEVERLKSCVKTEDEVKEIAKRAMEPLVKEITREQIDIAVKLAKAEAYKEFLPLLEKFRDEVVDKFIIMCDGNDYNKLNLMSMVDTIDCIYDKHIDNILNELVGDGDV